MEATILTVGDELLIGQVVDTNAAWLGQRLDALGIAVVRGLTVGDDAGAIVAALETALAASDLVLLTGGLGPTDDDRTVDAVARFFEAPLAVDPEILGRLEARWQRRGRAMPANNRRIARVPDGFEVLPNPVGSAPGLWRLVEGDDGARIVAVLPGVPAEMKAIFDGDVAPRLERRPGREARRQRTLRTAGVPESELAERLGDLADLLTEGVSLASLPSVGGVRLRLSASGPDAGAAARRLDALEARIRERAGEHIYGVGDDPLESAVGRLLTEHGLTIATAESCTGGLIAHRLTEIPGSSAYLLGGIVAYSNAVKVRQLGVPEEMLAEHGAVSEAVAQAMAQGVRERLGADLGLATTGVAGPDGGTEEKPVGTVWIALVDARGGHAQRFQFGADRTLNKALSATYALDLVRRRLALSAGG